MSDDEFRQYRAYRNTIKYLLLVVGLWPNKKSSQSYLLLSYSSLLLSVITTFGIIGHVRMNFTDVTLATKSMSIMISFSAVILKIATMMINREDANELHEILDLWFSKLLTHSPIPNSILSGLRILRYLAWSFTIFVFIVTFNYMASPIISIIYQYFEHVNTIKYSLPYPGVYPWSIDPPGFRYKLQLLIELIATVPLFCVTAGIDSLFTMYGFQMVGQLREMSHRITHIDEMNNDEEVIRECVLQHYAMMRCRDILQKIYGPVILWIMTTNAIILCSLIFQFSQSENYRNAIYACDWYRNRRFMTSVLIMLTQKPLMLTACNFAIVSLDIFGAYTRFKSNILDSNDPHNRGESGFIKPGQSDIFGFPTTRG
ncbi:hypothetical protein PV328_008348 [Microctonus aethiopoides]|uniref:Odorant receptor n=1 Tax=Microctonus aethiopoides TaxID=144406 RepID=A0AA39FJC3_9HYME|nr:hypothetical protein PV328_008348 [Microctonus aethiopoides]